MELAQSAAFDLLLLRDFAIALFIGALIGVEREHSKEAGDPQFGGLRTFVLLALLGALAGELAREGAAPVLLVAGLLGLVLLLAVTTWTEGREKGRVPGLTTEVAALLTYLLGGAVALGHPEVAVMLAIATSAVLAFKTPLHAAVRALGRDDLVAGLKLLAATFIVLPLLPDRALDPWGALNPYTLWLLVLLISGLSLVGYVATRLLGANRGIALTGLFGGLVSSTAVTLALARQSRRGGAGGDAIAVGMLLSWAVMLVRVVVEIAVLDLALLGALLVPLAAMFAVSAALVAWFYRRAGARAGNGGAGDGGTPQVRLRNPFSLGEAVRFGLLFAVVLLAVELAREHLPEGWLLGVAALAGATDVDAITLSLAQQSAAGGLPQRLAALAILLAAWSNTVVKCALAMAAGDAGLRSRMLPAAAAVIAAGAAGFVLD